VLKNDTLNLLREYDFNAAGRHFAAIPLMPLLRDKMPEACSF
jgi:hypothetical protein